MNAHNDGGPAFPLSTIRYEDGLGMTLRDYFAAKAMTRYHPGPLVSDADVRMYAEMAYRVADAMIAAREKGGTL